jgi:hypothetical protein
MAGPQPINDISNGNAMHVSMGNVGNDQMMVNNPSSQMMPNMSNMSHMTNNAIPNQINQNRVPNPMAMTGNRSELLDVIYRRLN